MDLDTLVVHAVTVWHNLDSPRQFDMFELLKHHPFVFNTPPKSSRKFMHFSNNASTEPFPGAFLLQAWHHSSVGRRLQEREKSKSLEQKAFKKR